MSDRLDLVFVLDAVDEYVEALGGRGDDPDDVMSRVRAFDRAALQVYLSACSEDNACESWNEHFIQRLWARACDVDDLDNRVCTIRDLCARANGWWHWARGAEQPEFVPLSEWEQVTGMTLDRSLL